MTGTDQMSLNSFRHGPSSTSRMVVCFVVSSIKVSGCPHENVICYKLFALSIKSSTFQEVCPTFLYLGGKLWLVLIFCSRCVMAGMVAPSWLNRENWESICKWTLTWAASRSPPTTPGHCRQGHTLKDFHIRKLSRRWNWGYVYIWKWHFHFKTLIVHTKKLKDSKIILLHMQNIIKAHCDDTGRQECDLKIVPSNIYL